jgi:hypothetical protein
MERQTQRLSSRSGIGNTSQPPKLSGQKSLHSLIRRYFGDSSGLLPTPPTIGSVSHQIPVEIWEIILHEAINSPLFPLSESGHLLDSFLYTSQIFIPHCTILLDHRDTIKQFRLVCRTWASILQPYAMSHTFTKFDSFTVSCNQTNCRSTTLVAKRRIHFCSWVSNTACPFYATLKPYSPDISNSVEAQDAPIEFLSQVRCLILGLTEIDELDLLQKTPNALAISLTSPQISKELSLKNIFTTVSQLMHLEVTSINCERDTIASEDIEFPQLRSLSLSFSLYGQIDQNALSTWRLPNLHTLHVHGPSFPFFSVHIYKLASRYKSSLRELIDTRSYRDHYPRDLPLASFWNNCTELTAFGIDVDRYHHYRKKNWQVRDTSLPPLTLFVLDFHRTGSDTKANFAIFKDLQATLNICQVFSIYSWDELRRKRLYSVVTPSDDDLTRKKANSKRLAKMLINARIPVCDRLGVSLQDGMVALHS